MADDNALKRLLEIVCNVFDAYSAVLFLPLPDAADCRLAASFSLGDDLHHNVLIGPGEGIVGWIVRNRKPLLISNFDQQQGVLGYYKGRTESKIKAFMGCPTSLEGPCGVICVDSMRTYTFGEKEQKILSQFAALTNLLHDSIRQMDFGQTERRYYHGLRVISELRKAHPKWHGFLKGLLEVLAQTTGLTHCFLTVLGQAGRNFHIEGANRPIFHAKAPGPEQFPLASGLIGWVYKHGEPVYSGQGDSFPIAPLFGKSIPGPPFVSAVCQPVIFARRTRAVLVLAGEDELPVTPELKSFVSLAAEYLALFLENLHFKSRLLRPEP
ncbi:MAG: GAF domain-containing protein [Desulfovibrionaceae bacterium]|nr:GAF domain-containing protein [Desulfovibrionaceae bacterium]MBF0514069.1 GAF domain-containing protein [Desulfovibrionaceae bacterium]